MCGRDLVRLIYLEFARNSEAIIRLPTFLNISSVAEIGTDAKTPVEVCHLVDISLQYNTHKYACNS